MNKYINAKKLCMWLSDVQLGNYASSEYGREYKVIDDILQAIDKIDKADVREDIHGEWIPDDYEFYHCSECGFEWDEREYITPYCPNCGARMDGDTE